MYYKLRDIQSLTARLLYRMFPDPRNIVNSIAPLFMNVPKVRVDQKLTLMPRIPTTPGRMKEELTKSSGPHVLPRERYLRVTSPMPRYSPSTHAASALRGRLGHVEIQQQSRLAYGRNPAFRLVFR